jgi:hypothetical protein
MSIIAIAGRAGSGKDTVGTVIQYLTSTFPIGTKTPFNIKENYSSTSNWQVKKFADKLKDIVCILIGCTREQLENQDFKNTELGEEWNTKFYYITDNQGGILEKHYSIEEAKEFLPYWDDSITVNYPPEIEEVEQILTPRLLLQVLGTECGRDIIHPNIWVNSLFSEYVVHPKGTAHDLKDWSKLYTHKECKNCKKQYSGWKRQYLCKECIEDDSIQFYPNWLITDMRFPNEYDAVKSRGGITIRVIREFYEFSNNNHEWGDKECRQGKLLKVNADLYSKEESNKVWRDFLKENAHQSEIALDQHQFDYEIINDGSIEDLIEKVKQILIKEKII